MTTSISQFRRRPECGLSKSKFPPDCPSPRTALTFVPSSVVESDRVLLRGYCRYLISNASNYHRHGPGEWSGLLTGPATAKSLQSVDMTPAVGIPISNVASEISKNSPGSNRARLDRRRPWHWAYRS